MKPIPRTALAALVAAATLVPAQGALAGKPLHHPHYVRFRGTVVHLNKRAHSFTIATGKGVMRAIHAKQMPRIGEVVIVWAHRLRNGTYALRGIRVVQKQKRAKRVRLRGVVSYVNPRRQLFVLSGEGVSLTIRRRAAVRIASALLPTVGEREEVVAELEENGTVSAERITPQGETNGPFDLEGTVVSLDEATRTVVISAEDDDTLGETVTVVVPATLPFPRYQVGEEVELQVVRGEAGLTLTGASSDQGEAGAQDGEKAEGEQTDAADREDAAEEEDNNQGDNNQGNEDQETEEEHSGSPSQKDS